MTHDTLFPAMTRIRQHFENAALRDIPGSVRSEMEKLRSRVPTGAKVGVTVGSRGIRNIVAILEAVIAFVRECGAVPVLLSAMGSHGGGTERGQMEVLGSLGITAERLGAPVVACEKGREVGQTRAGWNVHMLESAFSVDAILPVNRVKTHTSFKGALESGLVKKLVVGLGGPEGSAQFHSIGDPEALSPLLEEVGTAILSSMPVIGGLAVVENAYEETARIEAVAAESMIERERELLLYSKSLMPSLPSGRLDGLVVEEIGKNFSGTGLDTNIIGRLRIQGRPEPARPAIRYITVLGLSAESHGNATGIGLADFTTQDLIDRIDRRATYLNNLTTTFVTRAFFPMFFATEEEAISTMMHCLRDAGAGAARLAFVPNTLYLSDCYVSAALIPEMEENPRVEILGEPRPVTFDAQGRLLLRLSHAQDPPGAP